MNKKAYVGGPLTDLEPRGGWLLAFNLLRWFKGDPLHPSKERALAYYEAVAALCEEVLGVRATVPHELFPICDPNTDPTQIYGVESRIIREETSVLIVNFWLPSTGMSMEIEIALHAGVPVVVMVPLGVRVTEFLRGASVQFIEGWKNEEQALRMLGSWLSTNIHSMAS